MELLETNVCTKFKHNLSQYEEQSQGRNFFLAAVKRMVITHPYSLSTVVHISIYIERYDTVSLLVQFFLTLVMVIEQNYITCSQLPSWPEMITILEHKCFMFLIHQSMQESSHERSP